MYVIRPFQNMHQNAPGSQILNFQNIFDSACDKIRLEIHLAENFFGSLISI